MEIFTGHPLSTGGRGRVEFKGHRNDIGLARSIGGCKTRQWLRTEELDLSSGEAQRATFCLISAARSSRMAFTMRSGSDLSTGNRIVLCEVS